MRKYFLKMIFFWLYASTGYTQTADNEFSQSYGSADFISISTGRLQPIRQAPSVATVVTAQEIQNIGAKDLDEVLETIPGIHVSRSAIAYNPLYLIRGISSDFNPQVLMLINGIPITYSFLGDRSEVWGGMPVNGISRIEIIRGPGSAANGADAFAGVINIVTKNADDILFPEVGVGVGSFGTRRVWGLYGNRNSDWSSSITVEMGTIDGQSETILSDAQSQFDRMLGSSASLAPGGVNTGVDNLDIRFDLSILNWRLRAGYQGRREIETGAGLGSALDPRGFGESDRWNIDLTYTNETFSEHWDFMGRVHYFDADQRPEVTLFPPGADFTALGGGNFPEGVLAQPEIYERHYGMELDWSYYGIQNHQLRIGLGFRVDDLYRVREIKNYTQNFIGIPVSLGGLTDVSQTAPFTQETLREIYFMLLQDEWKIINDWTLTAGVRIDNYSDFGETINPRLALVWNTRYDLTTKFLYGRAFRAPSFAEQFNINNPVALGNPDLGPETIDTYEIALDYQPNSILHAVANIFAYKMRDVIRLEADPPPATSRRARNTSDVNGYGFEGEISYSITRQLTLISNYAFQKSKDKATGKTPGMAPEHQAYLSAVWKTPWNWAITGQMFWIGKRDRASSDTRSSLGGYTATNIHARYNISNDIDVRASITNIFDEDIREPSIDGSLIPNDLPQAGRALYGEINYRF